MIDEGDPHLRSLRLLEELIGEVPSLQLASRIEDLFKVPRGFLTATPSQALGRALEERLAHEQARQLTGLRELKERFQLRSVAFRGAPETLAATQDLLNPIVEDQPLTT
ncbi:hypothetical protein OTB20_18285 [Streptomyces sp. H27-H1]|uniref:hypothetical protein n=1 Tax=Streptomyces sp. H27-H1 TaxID=2996461 RepID=UPI00226FDD3C|nr:hypothetical protein [Streptomyces sp. H27-H1]MCY0928106.1 hypothetical protein [Streptomyces sp. H27-H1]